MGLMPLYSHTVRKRGRNCEACHGNQIAAGNGLFNGEGIDLILTKPSPPVYPSLRLLSKDEKDKVLKKTLSYRKWRFKTLWQDYKNR